jgi:Domain of unknown function (DUF1906)
MLGVGGRRARGRRGPAAGWRLAVLPAVAGLAVVTAAGSTGSAEAAGRPDAPSPSPSPAQALQLKTVSYRGYRFQVPRAWPVIRSRPGSVTCVRFDVHAVYLGPAGINQHCPSWLVGTTESLLISPGPAASQRQSVENPVANSITATAPHIAVTATFDSDPAVIYRILASAGLAAPVIVSVNPAELAAALSPNGPTGPNVSAVLGTASVAGASKDQGSADLSFRATAPVLSASLANRIGLGFDACAAPSVRFMQAWRRHSRYRAVGVYIGGSDRACDQRNLTSAWVRLEAAAGWRFIPMYVGPQASLNQLRSPARQGTTAAADAVLQAGRLGFGPRTPLYYDMEAYRARDAGRALTFLSAWTRELHRLGYESGVYSSSSSGVADLSRHYRSRRYAMPDVIFDALWNGSQNVADHVYGRGDWTNRRRVHQFSGNVLQTFGGDTMDIDQDYLDLALAAPGGTTESSPGAAQADGVTRLFYEGRNHRLFEEVRYRHGRWKRLDMGGRLSSSPSVVQIGRSSLAVFYRSRSGHLTIARLLGRNWGRAHQLRMMGVIGGAPHAVAQANGVIDVFWPGRYDRYLWYGEFSPGSGWSGPHRLGGRLGSPPTAVETNTGLIEVFWEGTHGNLWRVMRGVGGRWSRPRDLGMGPMGGWPHAVMLPSGQADVFWRGRTRPHHVWAAFVRLRGARGPIDLGGRVVGEPWPVYAGGLERVFYRGPHNKMWVLRRYGRRWGQPRRVGHVTHVTASPFAATGRAGAPLELFWRGRRHMLWSARDVAQGRWQRPHDLGGRVI